MIFCFIFFGRKGYALSSASPFLYAYKGQRFPSGVFCPYSEEISVNIWLKMQPVSDYRIHFIYKFFCQGYVHIHWKIPLAKGHSMTLISRGAIPQDILWYEAYLWILICLWLLHEQFICSCPYVCMIRSDHNKVLLYCSIMLFWNHSSVMPPDVSSLNILLPYY